MTGKHEQNGGLRLAADIGGTRDGKLWNEFVTRYHYPGYKALVGAQMRYAVGKTIMTFPATTTTVPGGRTFAKQCRGLLKHRQNSQKSCFRFDDRSWVFRFNMSRRSEFLQILQ